MSEIALEDSSKRKRDPIARACGVCSRKKIRCSGGQPCQSCVKSNSQCVYTEAQRRGPKVKKARTSTTSAGDIDISSFVSPTTAYTMLPPDTVPRSSLPPLPRASTSALPITLNSTPLPTPPLGLEASGHVMDADILLAAQRQMQQGQLDPLDARSPSTKQSEDSTFAERLYATEDPGIQGFHKLLPHEFQNGDTNDSRRNLRMFRDPDIDQLNALADQASTQNLLYNIYWCFIHPLWPLLYRPAFDMASVADKHPHLHYAILAISCRYDLARQSQNVPGLPPMIQSQSSVHTYLGDLYFDRSKKHFNLFDINTSIETIQALVLMSLRESAQGRASHAYTFNGMASRMIYSLNMHQSQPDGVESHDNVLFQTISRTIWCCYILDKYLALALGKPFSMRVQDIDTPYPSQYESDEFSLWESDAKIIVPNVAAQVAGVKTRALSNMIAWITLFNILERILDSISSFRKLGTNARAAELNDLDSALETWSKQHAEALEYSKPNRNVPPHLYCVRLWYHTCYLILHRPFIPLFRAFPREQGVKSSYTICIESAQAISDIVTRLDNFLGLYRLSHYIVFVIFQAAIMFLAQANSSQDDVAAKGNASLSRCLEWLDKVGSTYAMTPPYQHVLRSLLELSHKELRSAQQVKEVLASRRGSRAPSPNTDFFLNGNLMNASSAESLPSSQIPDFNSLQNFLSDMPFTLPLSSDDMLWNGFTNDFSSLFDIPPTASSSFGF